MDNLTIDFYDETHAAVTINWPDDPEFRMGTDSRKYYDALLVACYTLRQMRNFRGQRELGDLSISFSTRMIRDSISLVRYSTNGIVQVHSCIYGFERSIFRTATDMGMDWEQAKAKYAVPTYLVPYNNKGSKRFRAELLHPQSTPSLILRTSGFGLLGFGIRRYAPDSVHHAFIYIVSTYINDESL